MSDATKRKCGCDWSLWETCDECNPDDEAAEIRHLRTRLAESEAERQGAESSADIQRERAKVAARVLESERGVLIACTRRAEKAEAEVAKAWACRDDEVVLRTMEADKRAAAETERDDLLGALREPMALCEKHLGCGDHSCRFVTPKGMATNGGCRCKDRPYVMPALEALFKAARAAIAKVGGKESK